MPLPLARKLLGPDAIIGLSVGTLDEAREAVRYGDDLDYVGLGAVWPTGSKDLKGKQTKGPEGIGALLDVFAGTSISTVAIGQFTHLPLSLNGQHPVIGAYGGCAQVVDAFY